MIVGVVADGMALGGDRLEPIDILLLEHPAHTKRMDHTTALLYALAGRDRVFLGRLIQVPFLVIPMRVFPSREISSHLQVERDRDLRRVECDHWRPCTQYIASS